MKINRVDTSLSVKILVLGLLFLLMYALPLSAQGLLAGASKTERIHATSESLSIYDKPDLSSDVLGRLIYDEMIVVSKEFQQPYQTGFWFKILEPYVGYYLNIDKPLTKGGETPQSRESYFREPVEAPLDKLLRKNDEDEGEEEKGFFASIMGFFSDDEEEMPEEATPAEEAPTEETPVQESAEEVMAESELQQEEPRTSVEYSPFWMRDKKKTTLIGLGAALASTQEDDNFSTSGTPTEIYLELMGRGSFLSKLRFGINSISASNDQFEISTNSLYAAFRIKPDQINFDDVSIFVMGGLAWMQSSLSGDDSGSFEGLGVVWGGGALYMVTEKIGLGGQLISFMKQADFNKRNISIGSTQIQFNAGYSF